MYKSDGNKASHHSKNCTSIVNVERASITVSMMLQLL